MGAIRARWEHPRMCIQTSTGSRSWLRADKSPGYFAHDGGISRTLDGYAGLDTGSCSGTNQFDSLSQTLGSMTEFVSVSRESHQRGHTAGRNAGQRLTEDQQRDREEYVAECARRRWRIQCDQSRNPSEWFAANPYVTILKCELGPACNDSRICSGRRLQRSGWRSGSFQYSLYSGSTE